MPTLSKLVVKLEAESAKLHTELDRANRKLSKLGRTAQKTNRTLTGAIAGMSRAVKGFIAIYAVNQLRSLATAAVDAQSEIRNLTTRLGGDQEQWARLIEAAHQADVTFQQLSTSSQRMSRSIGEAAQGTGQAGRALDRLGLSAKNLLRLNTQQQLYVIAEALHKVKNQTDRVTLAVEIFGRSGTQMLQMLDGGAAGLAKLEASAASMGVEVSTKTDKAMLKLEMAMKKFGTTADYTWRMVVSEFAPSIATALDFVSDHMRSAVGMAIRLGKSIAKIGAYAVHSAGISTESIGAMAKSFVALGIRMFVAATDAIAGATKAVIDYIVGLYQTAKKAIIGFLDSVSDAAKKVVDYVSAVTSSAADTAMSYWDKTTSWIGERVGEIHAWAREIVGDDGANDIADNLNKATKKVSDAAAKSAEDASNSIKEAYAGTAPEINNVTETISDGVEKSSQKTISSIEKMYNKYKTKALDLAKSLGGNTENNLLPAYESIKDWVDYIVNGGVAEELEAEEKAGEKLEDRLKSAANQMSELAKGHTKVAVQTVQLKDKFDSLGKSITSALSSGIVEGRRFSDVINGILKSIATSLLNKTFSGIGDAIAGGVSSIFGSMFGGGKATGGAVNSGTTYLVGEKGPELFTPERSGAIIPNHALQRPASAVNIVVNIHEGEDGGRVDTQQQGGQTIIDVIVDRVKSGVAQDITTGGSPIAGAIERTYGLGRAAGAY